MRTDKDRERERIWYAKNAEKMRARKLSAYYADTERRKSVSRAWKARNRDHCLDYKQRWDDDHKEHVKEWGKKYRAENQDQVSASFKKWLQDNPDWFARYRKENRDKIDAKGRHRRAIKAGAGGSHSKDDIQVLWDRQGGKCVHYSVCGNRLIKGGKNRAHVDHIEPIAPRDKNRLPGTNSIDNIQLLCAGCNLKKNNKDPYKFTQQHEGRLFPDLPQKPKRTGL